jgi:uncharacterized protein YndB with AHSA1/START domain
MMDAWGKATYDEIVPPERLAYRDYFTDADGNVVPDSPEATIEIQFIAEGGATRIRSVSRYDKAEDLEAVLKMGMEQGLAETWDRLEAYVAG